MISALLYVLLLTLHLLQDGTCQKNKRRRHVVTIDGYEDVPPNDETSLLQARLLQTRLPALSMTTRFDLMPDLCLFLPSRPLLHGVILDRLLRMSCRRRCVHRVSRIQWKMTLPVLLTRSALRASALAQSF